MEIKTEVTETEAPIPTLEEQAAQSAVIAADTAIALANGQAALAEMEVAQIVQEAKTDIEENEREISWLKERLTQMETTLLQTLQGLPLLISEALEQLQTRQLTPPPLPEIAPEVMTDLQGTETETLNIMPMVPPLNGADASPVEALETVADKVQERIKRLKIL